MENQSHAASVDGNAANSELIQLAGAPKTSAAQRTLASSRVATAERTKPYK